MTSAAHLHAQILEEPRHSVDIHQVGDVANLAPAGGENRRRHDGKSRVLGAGDLDLAPDPLSTFDHYFVHTLSDEGGHGELWNSPPDFSERLALPARAN